MNRLLLLLLAFFVLSCNPNLKTNLSETVAIESQTATTENFDWLVGKWKRTNEEATKETFENWDKISANEYSGIGFTMQGVDTIKQERIELVKSDGKWSLLVKVPEERDAITFKMTELQNKSFVCTNDSIDFPKKISYWLEGDTLKAKVSNDEMEIPFAFERLK